MMIKNAIAILIAAAAVSGATAQTNEGLTGNQRAIGYSVTDDIDIKGAAFGEAGTYSLCALLYSNDISDYKGCRLVGMRVAAGMDLGRTGTFLYNLDDAAGTLTEINVQKQRLFEGWNNIFFNGEGYEITGTENFLYGFDYVETPEMVAADKGAICGVGTSTSGGALLYQDDQLYSVSNIGNLCVQLIVDISSLPAYSMSFGVFDTGFKYKHKDEDFEIFTQIRNTGRSAVSNYTMALQFDGGEVSYIPVTPSAKIEPGASDTWNYKMKMPELGKGMHTLKAYVDSADGEKTSGEEKKSKTVKFAIYDDVMLRESVFMEVYNDQNNGLGAKFNDKLAEAMELFESGTVSLVNVHAPGTTLALEEAGYLHDVYAYTTPAFTVNRAYFPMEAHYAYDVNDYISNPIFDAMNLIPTMIYEIAEQDLMSPCFAGIDLDVKIDNDTRELTVTASGEVLPDAEAIFGELGMTLMLTEDGVKAPQTVINSRGMTTVNKIYEHNNVLRGFITAPAGDKLTVANGRYNAMFKTTIPEAWDASKLHVVGVLTKYLEGVTTSNMDEADVINARTVDVKGVSAVEEIDAVAADAAPESIYTLDGMRIDATDAGTLAPGIYVLRYTDGTTRKYIVR